MEDAELVAAIKAKADGLNELLLQAHKQTIRVELDTKNLAHVNDSVPCWNIRVEAFKRLG